MSPFVLIAFIVFSAVFAAILLAVAIWKDLSGHLGAVHRSIAGGIEPLADTARLERAARRLNHAVLRFEVAIRAPDPREGVPGR